MSALWKDLVDMGLQYLLQIAMLRYSDMICILLYFCKCAHTSAFLVHTLFVVADARVCVSLHGFEYVVYTAAALVC